jgi:phosphoribosyl-AMP cyclohydrolase
MKLVSIKELEWKKMGGLLPVVTQDFQTLEVLTLAYVNKEAVEKSINTGFAHYYRRSFEKVMKKGIESGNIQKIISIFTDCDNDSLVYLVEQKGPACHLGERTCFHKNLF